jgi:hypothetical protein
VRTQKIAKVAHDQKISPRQTGFKQLFLKVVLFADLAAGKNTLQELFHKMLFKNVAVGEKRQKIGARKRKLRVFRNFVVKIDHEVLENNVVRDFEHEQKKVRNLKILKNALESLLSFRQVQAAHQVDDLIEVQTLTNVFENAFRERNLELRKLN